MVPLEANQAVDPLTPEDDGVTWCGGHELLIHLMKLEMKQDIRETVLVDRACRATSVTACTRACKFICLKFHWYFLINCLDQELMHDRFT